MLPTYNKMVRANLCYFSQQCSRWLTVALEMIIIKSDLGQCLRASIYSQPRHKTALGLLWCAGFPNNTSKYIPPQLEQMLNNEAWKQRERRPCQEKFGKSTHKYLYFFLHSVIIFLQVILANVHGESTM